jgi:hypothetical protein
MAAIAHFFPIALREYADVRHCHKDDNPPVPIEEVHMETGLVLDQPQGKKARRFLRHFFEMIAVMMLGMVVLGAAFGELHRLALGSGFADAWRDHVGLAAFAMAFNMTVPMVLWMRYRGHSWERGGEMAAGHLARGLWFAHAR